MLLRQVTQIEIWSSTIYIIISYIYDYKSQNLQYQFTPRELWSQCCFSQNTRIEIILNHTEHFLHVAFRTYQTSHEKYEQINVALFKS